MPIFLVTGAPGHGKTQWTLFHVEKEYRGKVDPGGSRRRVFYSGIPELSLDWDMMDDPTALEQVPTGSIIVIDEAQKIFRARGTGAAVPPHVAYLETHRHLGHDLFVITQHPMLIDGNVRRLVDKHYHIQRPFGMQRANVHRFEQVNERPDKSRLGSVKTGWNYSKEVQGWYKSAEVHTVKRSIPARIWFFLSLPFLIGGLSYYTYNYLHRQMTKGQHETTTPGQPGANGVPPPAGPVRPQSDVHDLTSQQPRVQGLAYTAPAYDHVMPVNAAPVPSACISSSRGCRCWTDQATKLDVPDDLCRQIVKDGWYDARRNEVQAQQIHPTTGQAPIQLASQLVPH